MDIHDNQMDRFGVVFKKLKNSIDQLAIHMNKRWVFFYFCFFTFLARVFLLGQFYAILYLFGFFVLHNAILYLTPSELPTIQEEDDMENPVEITIEQKQISKTDDESKPVIRKLNEFNLW